MVMALLKDELNRSYVRLKKGNVEILDIFITKAHRRLIKASKNKKIGKKEARHALCYFFHLDKKEFKILIYHMTELGLVELIGNFAYGIRDI